MAQKTYTMDFVLNAVLNGGFQGVFSQAQQKFMQLGNEIKTLQGIQRDITSYQKQAQAVTNTTQKLQHLQSQQAKVKEQMEALKSIQSQDSDEKARNRAQIAALEREYDKYQQRIDTTQAALEKQRDKLEGLGGKLQDAGVDTANLGEKSAQLAERLKELEGEQKRVNEELAQGGSKAQEFGEKGEAAMEAVGSALAAAGVAVALKEIADGFVACVDKAAEFGSAMSAVEAISSANAEELEDLNQKAKETGLTTVYTAQQSANAMEYMAMAGWEAQEMLAGMSGMVNLAAAAGEDLAEVSDIVTDNLTAFRMEESETGHFADVLAQAAANSNTNIHKMGESFKNSSAVAGALGYSVEDVAVALGLMANNAVKGTRAGTALRNIFNGFVEGMTLTGQSFGEVEVSAINADGSVKGFMETVRELRGYFDQMTGAEKIMNAKEIANIRGYNGLLAIVNATDAEFEKLYADINNCEGAAQRMAKVKLDNMKGDLTIAKSAWEGLTIAIGEQFEPELRGLYQTGADVFNLTSQFVQEHPALLKMLTGAAAGVGLVTVALTGYAAVKKTVAALELAGLFASGGGAALVLAGALGVLCGALFNMSGAAEDGRASLAEMTEETRAAAAAMKEAKTAYQDTVDDTMAAARVAEDYVDKLEQLERQGKRSSEVNSEYQTTLALLVQTMPELEEVIGKTTDEYGRSVYAVNTSTNAIRANIQAMKDQALAAAGQTYLEELYKGQVDVLIEEQKNHIKLAQYKEKQNAAGQEKVRLQKEINALVDEWAKKEQEVQDAILEGRDYTPVYGTVYDSQEYKDLSDALGRAILDYDDWTYQIEKTESAIKDNQDAVRDAQNEIDLAAEAVENWSRAYGENAELTEADIAALEKLNPTIGAVLGNIQAMSEAYKEARTAAQESIQSQYELWDEAAKRQAISINSLISAQKGQGNYWEKYTDDLDALQEKVRSGEYDGLAEMVQEILGGGATPDAVNAIAGLADATDKKLQDMLKAWQDNKEAEAEARDAMALFAVDMETEAGNVVAVMEDMAAGIADNMDLSREAKAAGLLTMAGYVEGLNAGLNDPALAALQNKLEVKAEKASRPLMQGVYSDWDYSGHYAGGTTNAAPGWAVVGENICENGPEAILMRGGEVVFPAAKTAQMLGGAGGGSQSTYNFTIEVHGSADEGTVLNIKRAVKEAIEEAEEDKRRRGYT